MADVYSYLAVVSAFLTWYLLVHYQGRYLFWVHAPLTHIIISECSRQFVTFHVCVCVERTRNRCILYISGCILGSSLGVLMKGDAELIYYISVTQLSFLVAMVKAEREPFLAAVMTRWAGGCCRPHAGSPGDRRSFSGLRHRWANHLQPCNTQVC